MDFRSFFHPRPCSGAERCCAPDRHLPACLLAFLALVGVTSLSHAAGSAAVQVLDSARRPLPDAAIYAEPLSGQTIPKIVGRRAEIEQRGRKFLPLVSVVQAGTEVSFPNNDTVRHHVYSFSPAKNFELKLYSGVPASPVNFDKPGTVVLGCNIHDQMVAYIQIVDTPWLGKTDAEGKVRLDNLPSGRYRLHAWHYKLPVAAAVPEKDIVVSTGDVDAVFNLNVSAGAPSN
jgi:plastocyanin